MKTRPPIVVRNFFLEAEIDTESEERIRRLRGGPRTDKGEMRITLHQRKAGRPEPVLKILCRVGPPGWLRIAVTPLVGPSRNVEILTTPLTER